MKTYRTKTSFTLLAILAAVCFIPAFFVRETGLIVTEALIFLFIAASFFSIKYVIDGQMLKVYYFWGLHQDIDIKTITKIEPSHNILSSPAASLTRLKISYNKYDEVLVSPKNQEDFIAQLCSINPNIQRLKS